MVSILFVYSACNRFVNDIRRKINKKVTFVTLLFISTIYYDHQLSKA